MLHADHALARRHERAAMAIEANCVREQIRTRPDAGCEVVPIADGVVLFAGIGSPLTQATGLGMDGPVTDSDIEAMEAVYFRHGSPARVVVCPHADDSLLSTLSLADTARWSSKTCWFAPWVNETICRHRSRSS